MMEPNHHRDSRENYVSVLKFEADIFQTCQNSEVVGKNSNALLLNLKLDTGSTMAKYQ